MIELSKNINPYYPTKKILKELKKSVNYIDNYPDKHLSSSTNICIGDIYIRQDALVITNGTLDAMDLILKEKNQKIIGYFDPTFWGIENIALKNNYKTKKIEKTDMNDYSDIDINNLAQKADVIYLCNYNNPTLSYIDSKKLIKVIRNNPKCTFIIDETILIFRDDFDKKTMLKYIQNANNLYVLISCSKIFGVSGLRIGLLFTSKQNKINLIKKQIPYSCNIVSQEFINQFLNEFNNLDKCKKKIQDNFYYFIKNLDRYIIRNVIHKNVGFIMCELNDNIDYNDLTEYLLKNGIKISAINNYYNLDKKYIRISAGKIKDYKLLLKLLKKYKKKIKE